LAIKEHRIKGVVDEVGLVRDEDKFNTFVVTINMVVKGKKPLTFSQGEEAINMYRKELLGKQVEIATIIHSCPICGKGYNTELGMKQHVRMVHEKKQKPKTKSKKNKKSSKKRKSR
jgi:hypothetical protein